MYLEVENFLLPDEVETLRVLASSGTFVDGNTTYDGREGTKHNEQLQASDEVRDQIDGLVAKAFGRAVPLQFFTQAKQVLAPMMSRYRAGMYFKSHLDTPFFGNKQVTRSDLSMTVFLSPPDTYDGGALLLETEYGDIECKPSAGAAVCYSTMLHHQVEPVTRGERLAIISWFQSRVRDPFQRSVLFDIGMATNEVVGAAPGSDAARRLQRSYQNMQRVWSES